MDEDNYAVEEEDSTISPEREESDDSEEDVQSSTKQRKTQARKIIVNVALTKYAVVKKTVKHFKWKLNKKEDDDNWDVF